MSNRPRQPTPRISTSRPSTPDYRVREDILDFDMVVLVAFVLVMMLAGAFVFAYVMGYAIGYVFG